MRMLCQVNLKSVSAPLEVIKTFLHAFHFRKLELTSIFFPTKRVKSIKEDTNIVSHERGCVR